MGTILLAGVYGVGKSTLAEKLSKIKKIPYFSAGDLISSQNGEQYGTNKLVENKEKNQALLALRVSELLKTTKRIFLAGHFCIVNKYNEVDPLPGKVFDELQIERIILLETDPLTIQSHLSSRDKKMYSDSLICSLLETEHILAQDTAQRLAKPLLIHQMSYSETDMQELADFVI